MMDGLQIFPVTAKIPSITEHFWLTRPLGYTVIKELRKNNIFKSELMNELYVDWVSHCDLYLLCF